MTSTIKYQVYVAYLDDIPRYVGCGRLNRHLHVNSGTSHVRKLNEIVLKYDKLFEIKILNDSLSKDEAERLEHQEISKIGREDLNEGTLWNGTSGWGFLHGGHTDATKAKISAASKSKWSNLTAEGRLDYIQKLKDSPNSGRFVKGVQPHNRGKIGLYGKQWKLTNIITSEEYTFLSKSKFVQRNSDFKFIINMKADHKYSRGKRKNWFIVEVKS